MRLAELDVCPENTQTCLLRLVSVFQRFHDFLRRTVEYMMVSVYDTLCCPHVCVIFHDRIGAHLLESIYEAPFQVWTMLKI